MYIRLLTAALVAAVLLSCSTEAPPSPSAEPTAAITYVGSTRCAQCHAQQADAWRDSHHYQAMQPASEDTVAGRFDGTTLIHNAERIELVEPLIARIRTGDGSAQDFAVAYTFGAWPLQQYLVEFADGRKQALGAAWDARAAADGGQRWFHLYGERSDAALHWTADQQNWNHMCADCHSTNLRKNYRASDNTFQTAWSEVNVGCEACHGPGSAHAQAAERAEATLSGPGATLSSTYDSVYALTKASAQINTCAHCHSHREQLKEGFTPGDNFFDHYRLSLLDDALYFADGQMRGEVYVTGSFLQSKMHAQGVACSDCHDAHSGELLREGNATCTHCHNTSAARYATLRPTNYDAASHHFHKSGTAGAQCVNCHMPARVYMSIDARRDHSFRVPRPDLSAALGVPNACNACHEDRSPEWADGEIRRRYPDAPQAHFGPAIAAARAGQRDAGPGLIALAEDTTVAPIVRATALALMRDYSNANTAQVIRRALHAQEPLVRLGAVRALEGMPIEARWPLANRLLDDPLKMLRVATARSLAPLLARPLTDHDAGRLRVAVAEYIDTQQVNRDRPEALSNLGAVHLATGDVARAVTAYNDALDLDPDWVPALLNLADIYRGQDREPESKALLTRAAVSAPDSAPVRYAQALSFVRQGRTSDALEAFEQAATLDPDGARYVYAYGVALNSTGRTEQAVAVLEDGALRFARDADIVLALATIQRDRGDLKAAREHARTLLELRPQDPQAQALLRQLDAARQ